MDTTTRDRSERPPAFGPELSTRVHLVTVGLSSWLMIGLFVDGWAHSNRTQLETFFTPWHAIFYSGFAATAAWIGYQILSHQPPGAGFDRASIPRGYGLGAVGVAAFAAGGVGDAIWHTVFGIEVDIDALLSPTHLLLFIGLVLMLTTPWRAEWRSDTTSEVSFDRFLPVAISMALTMSLLSFFFLYLTPFTAPDALSDWNGYLAQLDEGVFPYWDYSHVVGITGVLVTNLLMVGPLLLSLRRWRLPFGVATLAFTTTGLLMLALEEFTPMSAILTPFLGGLAADLLIRALRPTPARPLALRVVATAIPAAMWTIHFANIQLTEGIGWTAEFWTGTIAIASLGGLALSVLLVPPAVPSSAWQEAS
jgi:hypothetical protein